MTLHLSRALFFAATISLGYPAFAADTPSDQDSAVTKSTLNCAPAPEAAPENGTKSWITPMTAYWMSNGYQRPSDKYAGTYTRLVVLFWPGNQGYKPCEISTYHTRDLVPRYLFGKHASLNLSADVKFGPNGTGYSASVSLLSLDHVSDANDGEIFTRSLVERAENYPLFLIPSNGANSIVSVTFNLKASDESTSQAAASAFAVVQSVASKVAPLPAVVTSLTQQSNQQVADQIDGAINKLFTKSISEQHVADEDIRKWIPGDGAFIRLYLPDLNDDLDYMQKPDHEGGEWLVTFEPPRPSVFNGTQICTSDGNAEGNGYFPHPDSSYPHTMLANSQCQSTLQGATQAAESETARNPTDVLGFHLSSGANDLGTVSAYIKQQSWYASSTTEFTKDVAAKKPSSDLTEPVEKFCSSVKTLIQGIGLNAVDAGIVVHSIGLGMPELPKEIRDRILADDIPSCQYYVPLKPSGKAASAAPPPAKVASHKRHGGRRV